MIKYKKRQKKKKKWKQQKDINFSITQQQGFESVGGEIWKMLEREPQKSLPLIEDNMNLKNINKLDPQDLRSQAGVSGWIKSAIGVDESNVKQGTWGLH